MNLALLCSILKKKETGRERHFWGPVPWSVSPSHIAILTDSIVKLNSLPYRKFKISQILQSSVLHLRYYPPNQSKFKCAHWIWCWLSVLVHIIIGFKFVSVFHSNVIADCMKARSRTEVFFHRRKGKVHLPHVSLLFPLSNRANKNHNCDLSVSKSCKYLLTKARYFQKGFPSWPRPKLADLTWLWNLSGRLPPCHC